MWSWTAKLALQQKFSYPFFSLFTVDTDLRDSVQQLEEAGRWDLGFGVVGCVGGSFPEGRAASDDGWDDPAEKPKVMWPPQRRGLLSPRIIQSFICLTLNVINWRDYKPLFQYAVLTLLFMQPNSYYYI